MKPQWLLLACLTLVTQAQADDSSVGSSLWRNADQRAEIMMQQGNASGAAKTYTDPRRRAFAQFKAGDYSAAAKELSALNDSEAHYNRGNALAHAGDLRGALNAFDAAIKLDAQHQDARHNRDLVARALEQSQDAEKDKSQNSQPNDKPENQQGDQQGKPRDSASSQQAVQNTSKEGPSDSQNAQGQNRSGAPPQDTASSTQLSDAEQARQDARNRLNKVQQRSSGDTGQDHAGESRDAQTNASLMTEKQMAQEQWLRSIPDDPGGLLRRKFMIQHLMRQRDAKP